MKAISGSIEFSTAEIKGELQFSSKNNGLNIADKGIPLD